MLVYQGVSTFLFFVSIVWLVCMFLDPFPNVKGSMCHAGLKKKPNIAMENGPLEDVFLIKHGDLPLLC